MDNTNTTPQNHHHEGGEHGSHGAHHGTHKEHSVESSAPIDFGDPAKRRKTIKIALIVGGILVLLGLLFSLKSLLFAAIVDGHPITRYAVIAELERQGGKDALETLVDKALISNEAQEKNIVVTSEEIDAELQKFEEQFSAGGQSLDAALEAENLTRDDLKDQILIRKQIEKLLGDRANVSEDELQAYITEGQITLPAGEEDNTKSQIRDQLRQQKLAQLSADLLNELHAKAKIYTFVEYQGGSTHEH